MLVAAIQLSSAAARAQCSATWRPACSRLNSRRYCSAQYLEIPYGARVAGGQVSGVGRATPSPYIAPPVLARIRRASAAVAALSRFRVPTILVAASGLGSVTEERTLICAARW